MPESSTNPANATYAFVQAFCEEVQRAALRNVVICPGSRSTPLALACAAQPGLRVWMHVDERSAAFFALGMARRLQEPVALLCTSGTAAANFFPAIVEARLTHVPLLVLTADRPPELRDNGAPQTIDQNRLYGTHVKWFVEVALPEASSQALRYVRTLANRAVALTRMVPAGPVHLNFPFREPLVPIANAYQPLPPASQRDAVSWEGRADGAPYVAVSDAPLGAASSKTIAHLISLLQPLPRGLIIAGPLANADLTHPLVRLAEWLGYPILADPLSQLRCGNHNRRQILSSYDAFLRLDSFVARVQPQVVLRFGAMPTSKPLLLYLQRYADCQHIVVDGQGGWNEPTQLATDVIHADPVALCLDLLQHFPVPVEETEEARSWLHTWQHADLVTRQALHQAMQDFSQPFEGRIFSELAELIPADSTLYVGNSMPVRDLDTFFWGGRRPVHILGNRGSNGIDGLVSSALGASAAAPSAPTILVIGDLSFFHDLNGLLAARLHRLNLTVILVNNDGGGIFSFLPQAAHPEHFEQLFGTPIGLDFQPVVQMYGGTFQRVATWEEFRAVFGQSVGADGLHVIELQTERASNVNMHRQLWHVVEQALEAQR